MKSGRRDAGRGGAGGRGTGARPAPAPPSRIVRAWDVLLGRGEPRTRPGGARAGAAPARGAAIDSSQVVVFAQDERGRYLSVRNPPPWMEGAVGRIDAELLALDDAARVSELKNRVAQTGVPVREELEITVHGETLVYELALDPRRDAAGNLSGVTGVMIDVTARRRALEALLAANDELESQVRVLHEALARAEERPARPSLDGVLPPEEDPVTGLPGPGRFQDRLAVAIVQAQRRKQKLAVVDLALDGLATLREKEGDATGDDVLCCAATLLQHALRQGDTVARVGDGGFALLVPELAHDEDVARVAEKVLTAFRQPLSIGGREVAVTASLGLALYPEDGADAEELLGSAREALDKARAGGGDGWAVHSPEAGAAAARRTAVETDLRRALVQGGLELRYQPVCDCSTGALQHVEALLRWRDAEKKLVPAAQFLDVAEAAGLAVPLGQWALQTGCAQARNWLASGLELPVAINLSPRQFAHPALPLLVRRACEEASLRPALLILEVSGQELTRNPEAALARVEELRALGTQVVLDGFGTAPTSLDLLCRLPITALKLERALVQELGHGRAAELRVKAAVALAHALDLEAVAVGVETEAQRVLLEQLQCDLVQGHLLGPPVPAAECEELFQRQRVAATTVEDEAPAD